MTLRKNYFKVLSVTVKQEGACVSDNWSRSDKAFLQGESTQVLTDFGVAYCLLSAPSETRSGFTSCLGGSWACQELCQLSRGWTRGGPSAAAPSAPASVQGWCHRGAAGAATAAASCAGGSKYRLLNHKSRIGKHFPSLFSFSVRVNNA